MSSLPGPHSASLIKRFAACFYELVLLTAIWFLCTWIFIRFFGVADNHIKRFGLQFFLWVVAGVYFVWCWQKSGQTLATQTWKIKLVNAQGNTLTIKQALQRYVLASASLLVFGLGFLWALFDKQHFFLHDRLLKTRLVKVT
jgi:uncharacterized RDD family membrane protein YckC